VGQNTKEGIFSKRLQS